MPKKATAALKAGALIEPDEDAEKTHIPSRRELIRQEHNIDKLPTGEVLRRLYVRHKTGIWQLVSLTLVLTLVWQVIV